MAVADLPPAVRKVSDLPASSLVLRRQKLALLSTLFAMPGCGSAKLQVHLWLAPASSRSHRHQCSERFDAVPKVLQPDVFILGVLVVVIVGDWHSDRNGAQILCDDRQRQTAA